MTSVEEERERCARIAEEQALAVDTVVGVRQTWVKGEIARKIRDGRPRSWLERHEVGLRATIAVGALLGMFFGVGSWIVVNWSGTVIECGACGDAGIGGP